MTELYQWLVGHPDQATAATALASTFIALVALAIAAISVGVSIKTVRMQTKHNSISIRPLPTAELNINLFDANLSIYNNGFGPIIVNRITISSKAGDFVDFKKIFSNVDRKKFRKFVGLNIEGKIINNSRPLLLISLKPILEDEIHDSEMRRIFIDKMSDVLFILEYTDLYGTRYKPYQKNFSGVSGFITKND
jgi:hypothetical protein